MMRAATLLCLAGAAGVWAFALYAPKVTALDPLPERLVGTFDLTGYEPPKGIPITSPLPPGRAYRFRFAAEGTYVFSVMLNGGYEILRREGLAAVSEGGVLTLTPISSNRLEDRQPAERFHVEWGEGEAGRFLALRHVDQAYTLRLHPIRPPADANR